MDGISLTTLADEQLEAARQGQSARAARTIHGGHDRVLRETVIALLAGHELSEHESPGEATLQVLRGRVRLDAEPNTWEGSAGDHVVVPAQRHTVSALEDAVVLLTVVKP
ncbi:cupin domain-containing protein [Fodinibacter luteus]|uniref:Cupin domain-containing protein n=1 Tax=Fodinibacter luteus TaxID=552064 RepID=A0ABP8KRV6_9MICO